MNRDPHVSDADLLKLINGDGESTHVRAIGEHVHHCSQCRKALEALAAPSAIWKGAQQLSSRTSTTYGSHLSHNVEEPTWHYPIDELLSPPNHPELLGRLGKYDVEREVGRGGMGIVLKAFDSELNRAVAIKILAPHFASHATARKRFSQEAIAAAAVFHPNVISVHDVNNEGKTPYLVMPYVDGPSLQTLVEQRGPLSEIEIVRMALQISAGLAAAHAQGLVHRDIKPANILVESGINRVMITDFGLARAADDASLTRTGWLTGTPNYMSPEQTRGQRVDARSDLFSLGSLIYFLASGRLPFRADSPLGVLHRIQHEEPTPIRQVNRQISQTLSDVIAMMHQKEPELRFQTSTELHDLLAKHLAYLHQPDISKPPKVRPVVSNRKFGWVFALAVSLALVSAFAIANNLIPMPFGSGDWNDGKIAQDVDRKQEDQSAVPLLGTQSNPAEETQAYSDEIENDRIGQDLFCEADQLYDEERYEESLAGFEKAARYDNVKAKSHYNIACIQAKMKQPDAAFESLNAAIRFGFIDEGHYQTDIDLNSLRDDKRFDELVARIRELKKADTLLSEAKREANNNQFVEAEKRCREALEINPNNDDAATHMGYFLHLQGRIDEAFPWHQRAANSSQFRALGNYNLACYYSLKGQADMAFEHLNKAIRSGLSTQISAARVRKDDDLINIRDDERFSAAIAALKKQEQLLQKGLDLALVEAYRAVALDPDQFEKQIRKFIPASLVLYYRVAGLDIEEHETLLQNRVPAELIQRYLAAGLKVKDHYQALLQRLEPSEAKAKLLERAKSK